MLYRQIQNIPNLNSFKETQSHLERAEFTVIDSANNIPQERCFPTGAIFYLTENSSENILQARKFLEEISDNVLHPVSNCYIGLLSGTKSYFKCTEKLFEKTNAIRISRDVKGFLFFGSHCWLTFLYARSVVIKCSERFTSDCRFADALNLEYRRFKLCLSWEDWAEGTLNFCASSPKSVGELRGG